MDENIPQITPPPVPTKHLPHKFLYIVVAVGVLLCAAILAYGFLPQNNGENVISNHEPKTATTSPDTELKDWKTYTSNEYDFQVLIPSDFEEKNGYFFSKETKQSSDENRKNCSGEGTGTCIPESPNFDIDFNFSVKEYEFKDFVETPSKINLNGQIWTRYVNDGLFRQVTYELKGSKGHYSFSFVREDIEPVLKQILSTFKFTLPQAGTKNIEFKENNELFTISTESFNAKSYFDIEGLVGSSLECGVNNSKSYYANLLNNFKESDVVEVYNFTYKGKSQDGGVYEVVVAPNKFGYSDISQFKKDFGYCAAGGSQYPFILNKDYLVFNSACGTGYDDESGLPHGCDLVKDFVEPTIKLK